ncbi:MAG: ABC transporter substrate-binding protein [Clostridia bacterium]|nr:ABC transporter substrate-binding protein [Clostridia bacterium]
MGKIKIFLLIILFFFIILLPIVLLIYYNLPTPLQKENQKEEVLATISVGYEEKSLLLLPLYVALNKGFFEKEHLTVKLQETTMYTASITGLIEEKYDILVSDPEVGMYYYQQNSKFDLAYIGQLTTKNGFFLLGRKDEEKFLWSDTRNKIIIGVKGGKHQEIILEHLLRKNNLYPMMNVHIINNLPLALRAGVFESGTGDFILVNEPTATLLEKNSSGQVVTPLGETTDKEISLVLIATKKQVEENKELYQAFLNALTKGLLWINQSSPEQLTTIAKHYFPNQDDKILLRGICRYKNLGCWPHTSVLKKSHFIKLQNIMLELGELNSFLHVQRFLDNSFAQQAVKSLKFQQTNS